MEHPASTGGITNTEDGATATPPGNEIHHNQVPLHISNIPELWYPMLMV